MYLIDTVTVATSKRVKLDGVLCRFPNAVSDSYMITNASGAAGDSNIVIDGDEELDGNYANQSGDRQGLPRLQKPTDCLINVAKAGGNKYGYTNPTTSGQGRIVNADTSSLRRYLKSNKSSNGTFSEGIGSNC